MAVPAPLAIVGPTASGKSALAMALATMLAESGSRAEVVSADAMAVYRGMDIGTAKPSVEERHAVPHHLIDVVEPSQTYGVSRYQREANQALASIAEQGTAAIVVGGTGLYVQAVVDDFTVPDQYPVVRRELELDPDTEALWHRLQSLDPVAATKMLPTNRRRILRALEVTVGAGRPFSSFGPGVDHYGPTRFRLAGLEIDRAELDRRIDERYDQQMAQGLLAEIEGLRSTVGDDGFSRTAAQALGYKELMEFLEGRMTMDEALDEARRRTKKFARRQQRWFRRDPRIAWFEALDPDVTTKVFEWWTKPDAV